MRIAFLGDIALVGQFDSTITPNIDKRIEYLREILTRYDFVVANLESPFVSNITTWVPKSMHLRADERCVSVLRKLRVNAVTLANNHIYDFGRKGVESTINTLGREGIKWFGVDGKSIIETIKNEKISLSGFCCLSTNGFGYQKKTNGRGVNILTRANLEGQVDADKKNDAVSIISVHWGIEHTNYPAIEHVKLAESICGDKTVIIHGHHPHQIQGIQRTHESIIAYSLGNALFDRTISLNRKLSLELNDENRKSFVLGVEVNNGKITNYDITGFYLSKNGIMPYDITKEMNEISAQLDKVQDPELYQNMRMLQYKSTLQSKFGKHDFAWLMSRINYYSIVAKITSIFRNKRYRIEREKFMAN